MTRIKLFRNAIICAVAAFGLSTETSASPATDTSVIRIGIAGTAPFILENGDKPDGISMQIWDEIAGNMDLLYSATTFPSVPDALDALVAGKVDAVIGPVSITSERAARMELTHPYFRSSLSILSRTDELGLWDRVQPFFTIKLLYALAGVHG